MGMGMEKKRLDSMTNSNGNKSSKTDLNIEAWENNNLRLFLYTLNYGIE